jgi:hypothetical protein
MHVHSAQQMSHRMDACAVFPIPPHLCPARFRHGIRGGDLASNFCDMTGSAIDPGSTQSA